MWDFFIILVKFRVKELSEKFNERNKDSQSDLIKALESSTILVDEGYVYNDITFSISKDLLALEPYATINDINSLNPIQPISKKIDSKYLVFKFRTRVSVDNLNEIHLITKQGSLKIPIPKS